MFLTIENRYNIKCNNNIQPVQNIANFIIIGAANSVKWVKL